MNSIPEVFRYSGRQVRTVLIDGEPWFVATDIARILGYRDANAMTRSLDADEQGYSPVSTPGGVQQMNTINESGFYRAVLKRELGYIDDAGRDDVRGFQRWVTHEVIPQIRRTGSFNQTEVEHALPQSYADALRALAETVERQEALEAKVAADAPKVDAYDQLMDADGFYSMEAAAKIIGVGRNTFYELLRQAGIIRPASRLPYQRYMHHFKIVTGSRPDGRGGFKPYETTKIRPSGLGFVLPKVAPGFNVRALTS